MTAEKALTGLEAERENLKTAGYDSDMYLIDTGVLGNQPGAGTSLQRRTKMRLDKLNKMTIIRENIKGQVMKCCVVAFYLIFNHSYFLS